MFAATLGQLGLGCWERVAGILAFDLGIEMMQLVAVIVVMPSLLLLSRTRAYGFLRIGGALFAGFASVGWIVQQLFGVHNPVDVVVVVVAHHAIWIASALFLLSLSCWRLRNGCDQQVAATAPSVELALASTAASANNSNALIQIEETPRVFNGLKLLLIGGVDFWTAANSEILTGVL